MSHSDPKEPWYAHINLRNLATPPAPTVRKETVEEFLARGGQIERITEENIIRDPMKPRFSAWKTARAQGEGL